MYRPAATAGKDASAARLTLLITPETATGVDAGVEVPEVLTLEQNYPNPFNFSTAIRYGLAEAGTVRLAVYDVLGREVAVVFGGVQAAGWHMAQWQAGDLASGLYVYRLEHSGQARHCTLMLVR